MSSGGSIRTSDAASRRERRSGRRRCQAAGGSRRRQQQGPAAAQHGVVEVEEERLVRDPVGIVEQAGRSFRRTPDRFRRILDLQAVEHGGLRPRGPDTGEMGLAGGAGPRQDQDRRRPVGPAQHGVEGRRIAGRAQEVGEAPARDMRQLERQLVRCRGRRLHAVGHLRQEVPPAAGRAVRRTATTR